MKKLLSLGLVLIILFTSFSSYGAPIDYMGGVNNEYEYEEIVFITGTPIRFKGEVKVKEKVKDNVVTTTYDFKLIPEGGEKGIS